MIIHHVDARKVFHWSKRVTHNENAQQIVSLSKARASDHDSHPLQECQAVTQSSCGNKRGVWRTITLLCENNYQFLAKDYTIGVGW